MNLAELKAVQEEIEAELLGHRFGRLFTLARFQFAVDFRSPGSKYLFISVDPSSPRVYLIRRRLRDLEKQSVNPGAFAVFLQKRLAGLRLTSVAQFEEERALTLLLSGRDELGADRSFSLAAQLTGRSANMFLLDGSGRILESVRETKGAGQTVGDRYSPPVRDGAVSHVTERLKTLPDGDETVSERLDREHVAAEHEARFRSFADAARKRLRQREVRLQRLIGKLEADAERHGEAERWKRFGDLLLANAGTAKRHGDKFVVIDYYDESMPEVEVEANDKTSPAEAADAYFRQYTKSRNAADEIAKRKAETAVEIERMRSDSERLEKMIEDEDEAGILEITGQIRQTQAVKKGSSDGRETAAFARTFTSSDGFKILVGKKAKDNDQLSFKVARSLDLWMHAADYPGSHVVVRNPNRREIPQKTLIEAAQLAAFYSQGRAQPKAAVHYTQKKFVHKPRGAAPGMVSLASFKTVLVEPTVPPLATLDR